MFQTHLLVSMCFQNNVDQAEQQMPHHSEAVMAQCRCSPDPKEVMVQTVHSESLHLLPKRCRHRGQMGCGHASCP